jgi:hypothetical protein
VTEQKAAEAAATAAATIKDLFTKGALAEQAWRTEQAAHQVSSVPRSDLDLPYIFSNITLCMPFCCMEQADHQVGVMRIVIVMQCGSCYDCQSRVLRSESDLHYICL